MKAHVLLQPHGHHYTYRLTDKGVKVALLFLFFHKHLHMQTWPVPANPAKM